MMTVMSCSAFKLYVKKQSNSCGVGWEPALNIQFKCATAYSSNITVFMTLVKLLELTELNINQTHLALGFP
jgi:hypothetical protein